MVQAKQFDEAALYHAAAIESPATTIRTSNVGMRGARRGSESPADRLQALESLYERHAAAVFSSARWICGSAKADEITKLVFADLWSQPGSLNPADRTIRTQMVLAVYRHATQKPQTLTATPAYRVWRRRTTKPSHAESQPDPTAANVLHNAIDSSLPDANQRCTLALILFGQCSYHEAARLMNESEHNILVTLRSALHCLRLPLTEATSPTG